MLSVIEEQAVKTERNKEKDNAFYRTAHEIYRPPPHWSLVPSWSSSATHRDAERRVVLEAVCVTATGQRRGGVIAE